jgi:hypothetical protein
MSADQRFARNRELTLVPECGSRKISEMRFTALATRDAEGILASLLSDAQQSPLAFRRPS